MVSAARLSVEFDSKGVSGVKNDIAGIGSALDSANGKGSSFFSTMMGTAGGFLLAGGFNQLKDSVLGVGSSIITANSNMEMWTMQLAVSTGSMDNANAVIKDMQNMAKISPFDLPELIQGANALESLGFSSQKWMTVIGDTAAGTNKSVDQVVQAMMDASTGEFERLKELGIRTSVQGDKIQFQFMKNGQMMTIEAENTAEGIENALFGIWDDKYGGAMETMADTWKGRIGNLKDTINMMLMDMGKPLFDSMKSGASGATKYLETFMRRMADGQGLFHSLLWAIPETMRNWSEGLGAGDKWATKLTDTFKSIERTWNRVSTVGRTVGRVVQNTLGKAFEFLGEHMDVVAAVGKSVLTVFGAMFAWGALTAIVGGLGAVLAALLSPLGLIVAAVAALYLAWDHNWFGIQEKTAVAWAVLEPIFTWIKDAVQWIAEGFEIGGWETAWARIKVVAGEAWGHIKDALSSVNWSAVWEGIKSAASSAIGWVVDQISSVNWSGFLSGAWGVIQAGLNWAWDAITSLNWSDFIPAIADLGAVLLQKIVSLPWGDYITAAGDLALLLGKKIINLPWGDYITAIEDFQTLVRNKIHSLPWGDFLDKIVDFSVLVGVKIKDLPWGDFIDKLADFGALVATALGTIVWTEIIEPIADFGSYLWDKLGSPTLEFPTKQEIFDEIKSWFGFGESSPKETNESGYYVDDDGNGPTNYGVGGGSGSWALPGTLPMELPGFGSLNFDTKGGGVASQLEAVTKAAIAASAAMVGFGNQTTGAGGAVAAVSPVIGAFGGAMAGTATTTDAAGATMGSAFNAIAASASARFSEASSYAQTKFAALQASITNQSTTARGNAIGQFAAMAAGAALNFATMNNNATSQASAMNASVAGQFLGMKTAAALQMAMMASNAKSSGTQMSTGMTGWILGAQTRIAVGLASMVASVRNAGGSGYNAGYYAGSQIGAGMAAGMYAYLGQISAAANAMVNSAAAAVRARAMISSPSRLFKQYGAYIGEGMELGILGKVGDVQRASDMLVTAPSMNYPIRGGSHGGYGGQRTGEQVTYIDNSQYVALNDEQFAQLLQAKEKTNAIYKHLTSRRNQRGFERAY